jgi:sigma-E factor negative regulatory protein RseA
MTDQILKSLEQYREMLSALADGELAAAELDSLLHAIEIYPELRQNWFSFQQIRAGIHREMTFVHNDFPGFANVVSEAIADVSFTKAPILAFSAKPAKKQQQPLAPFKAFAVAASVMFVVAFTWFANENQSELKQLALNNFTNAEEVSVTGTLLDTQSKIRQAQQGYRVLVSSGTTGLVNSVVDPGKSRDIYLSNKRIENYMLFHAENASLNNNKGMMPFARMSRLSSENQF